MPEPGRFKTVIAADSNDSAEGFLWKMLLELDEPLCMLTFEAEEFVFELEEDIRENICKIVTHTRTHARTHAR
jgi:hypothetical protein